jgi:hypothetical protein
LNILIHLKNYFLYHHIQYIIHTWISSSVEYVFVLQNLQLSHYVICIFLRQESFMYSKQKREAQACNSSCSRCGWIMVGGQPRQKVTRPHLKPWLGVVVCAWHSTYVEKPK